MKLSSFQTIEAKKNNRNYLDNLFNIQSSIQKYKRQLYDVKLNDKQKIKLRNTLDNESFEDKKRHVKIKTDIISGEINKKINKENIKVARIYNNRINNKKKLIKIIDNTDNDESKNQIQEISSTLNTDRENKKIIKILHEKVNNQKTNREAFIRNKLMNLKYYMNEIDQNKTFRNERENINKHKLGLKSDLMDSFEEKKISNFNLKKILIKDFNKKSKKNEKENILILENITNDNINLKTIDNINRTEPNQIIHIKHKIIKNEPKDNNYKLSAEKNQVKRKISAKIYPNKPIHLNSNNLIKKQKINFNENKIMNQINIHKNLNKTTNDFNYINYSLMNQINSNYKNILDMNSEQKSEKNNNNMDKEYINIENDKKNKKVYSNNDKKPSVTIKNTVINLNIDTGFIINPFDKTNKIKPINSKKISNYSIREMQDNIRGYDMQNKNYNNYKKNEKNISNLNHHITNENMFQTLNEHDNNLLPLNEDINNINKKKSKNIIVFDDINQNKIDNNTINGNRIHNKSINNKIKKHIKFNSMKIDAHLWNQFNKKDAKNLYLRTNENFFKH